MRHCAPFVFILIFLLFVICSIANNSCQSAMAINLGVAYALSPLYLNFRFDSIPCGSVDRSFGWLDDRLKRSSEFPQRKKSAMCALRQSNFIICGLFYLRFVQNYCELSNNWWKQCIVLTSPNQWQAPNLNAKQDHVDRMTLY